METFFQVIGASTIFICLVCLIVYLIVLVEDIIKHLRRKHQYKHRFDRPPLAKCYCKDCVNHGIDGKCFGLREWITADNWFCWKAEPRKKG